MVYVKESEEVQRWRHTPFCDRWIRTASSLTQEDIDRISDEYAIMEGSSERHTSWPTHRIAIRTGQACWICLVLLRGREALELLDGAVRERIEREASDGSMGGHDDGD